MRTIGVRAGPTAPIHQTLICKSSMLRYALIFLVIALIAEALGLGGVAGESAWIAHVLFVIFLVLFIVSLVFRGGGGAPGLLHVFTCVICVFFVIFLVLFIVSLVFRGGRRPPV